MIGIGMPMIQASAPFMMLNSLLDPAHENAAARPAVPGHARRAGRARDRRSAMPKAARLVFGQANRVPDRLEAAESRGGPEGGKPPPHR